MGHTIDLYSLPPAQVAKVRGKEGVEGVRRRCKENGEHLGTMEFADGATELFDALDVLLSTRLADLLGSELGDLDGAVTEPRIGHLNGDDISDCIEALEQLAEALELDADEEEDYEGSDLLALRNRAEEIADDLGLSIDDDFADAINELIDNLKAALDEESDIVAIVEEA
jgi:hypothetical protein